MLVRRERWPPTSTSRSTSPPQFDDAIIAEIERRGGTYDPQEKIAAFVNPRLPQNRRMEIGFLENATFLKELHISFHKITDISPLSNLTSLEKLDLGFNRIREAGPLAGLTSLKYLDIGGNEIVVLEPLVGLTSLEHLDISNNEAGRGYKYRDENGDMQAAPRTDGPMITDLRPLANLKNLKILLAHRNHIKDLRPLVALNSLETLRIDSNRIDDLSPLAELKPLKQLNVDDNEIVDVGALIDLKARYGVLELAYLGSNQIADRGQIETLNSKGVTTEV